MPQQQQSPHQQMPPVYPPQQIPVQQDPDISSLPGDQQTPKSNIKIDKFTAAMIILGVVIIGVIIFFISAIVKSSSNSKAVTNEAELSVSAASTPLPDGWFSHTVREGDTCQVIADEYGISEHKLREVNLIPSACDIRTGDVLVIPPAEPAEEIIQKPVEQPTAAEVKCNIKGIITRKGDKIYHCPGWKDYDAAQIDTSKGERWFCSPEEAEAAGWRAAGYSHGVCTNE